MLCVRAVQGWQFADFLNPKPENPDFIDNEPAPAFMGGRRGRGRGRSATSPSSQQQQQQQQQMQGLPEFENDSRSQEVHANIGRMGEESDAETVASSRSSGFMPEIVASPGADVQDQNWPTVNGDLLRGLEGLDHMSDYSPSPVAVEPVAVSKADTTQVSGLCAVPPTAAELAAPAPATPLPMEGTFCVDANADADMQVAAGVRDGQADMESSPDSDQDSDEDGLPGRPGRPSSSSKPDPPPPPPPLAPALAETRRKGTSSIARLNAAANAKEWGCNCNAGGGGDER